MAVSMFKGKNGACPSCGSACIRLATKAEHPNDEFVTLKAYRVCEVCAKVFEPPTSRTACVAICVIAVSCALWFLVARVLPWFGKMVGDGDWSLSGIGLCLLYTFAVIGGFQIAYAGAKRLSH